MKIIKKLYASYIKWYDCNFSDFFECSIGDIILQRDYPSSNQLLLTSRLLDVENYISGENLSFPHQNAISYKAYGAAHKEERGNDHFRSLIESYQNDGYHQDSFVTCDNQLSLMDGNHRMGLHLFLGIDKVKVRIVRRKAKFNNGADWYYKVGLKSVFMEKLFQKYKNIQSFLIDSGNTFCAIIGNLTLSPGMSPLEDLKHLTTPLAIRTINSEIDSRYRGGRILQFSLTNPQYIIENGNLVSSRIEEIRCILQERYGEGAPIIISSNCLEGKALFQKFSEL